MSIIDDLREQLIEEEAEELGVSDLNEGYKIQNDDSANFFLKRLEEMHSEIDSINEFCDSEIEKHNSKVNKFRESKTSSLQGTINYFESLLESYAESKLKDSTKKSYKLPFGTLQFRKSPSKYEYGENVLDYLKNNNLKKYISVTENINKAELKKAINVKDGAAYIEDTQIPGINISEGDTNFNIKLN